MTRSEVQYRELGGGGGEGSLGKGFMGVVGDGK